MIDISEFKWSFSRLNSFHGCKLAWYKTYILKEKGIGNAFAEYGTLIHEIMERFALGELEVYELSTEFRNRFDSVQWNFPYNHYINLKVSYRNQGIDYLNQFESFNAEVLGVEKELDFVIDGYKFTGFIDLVLKKGNEIIILDHKSKAKFTNSAEQYDYARQLYLYSIQIYNEYGVYPSKLVFNMFRKQNIITIPFDIKHLEETKVWMLNTINLVSKEEDFDATTNEFMCNNLCNHRANCDKRVR